MKLSKTFNLFEINRFLDFSNWINPISKYKKNLIQDEMVRLTALLEEPALKIFFNLDSLYEYKVNIAEHFSNLTKINNKIESYGFSPHILEHIHIYKEENIVHIQDMDNSVENYDTLSGHISMCKDLSNISAFILGHRIIQKSYLAVSLKKDGSILEDNARNSKCLQQVHSLVHEATNFAEDIEIYSSFEDYKNDIETYFNIHKNRNIPKPKRV